MNRKGQSMVEYLLILGAVLAAVIVFATSVLKGKISNSLNQVADKMENQVGLINFGGG